MTMAAMMVMLLLMMTVMCSDDADEDNENDDWAPRRLEDSCTKTLKHANRPKR